MNSKTPDIISELADGIGGVIHECESLPDGSGFATMSMALPEDHWLYETTPEGYTPRSTYPMMAGRDSKARDYLSEVIVNHGGKYGVKCATMNGREDDFDPDALVRNIEIGLFGLFTPTGLTGDPEDSKLFDPIEPGSLSRVLLETLQLALHDGLLKVDDVCRAIAPASVEQAVVRHNERLEARRLAFEELSRRKGWDKLVEAADTAVSEDRPREEI